MSLLSITPTDTPFDFICVTGDAYVDHPSFGIAIISRVLESEGYHVGIIAQPQSEADFTLLGAPLYGFFVTGGNIDSMVANYTVSRKFRHYDAYSPGGKNVRPDRTVDTYCQKLKELYPDSPIVIGGLEASLRRFAHYDYWANKILPSILISSGADICVYGMGEHQTRQISARLANGSLVSRITDIRGTAFITDNSDISDAVQIPSFEKVKKDKYLYAKAEQLILAEQDEVHGKTLVQPHGERFLVQIPPSPTLTREEFDAVYALPYTRKYHPSYESQGGVPAIEEVEFSLIHNRGCFGDCNFCAITLHQGRRVVSRSIPSVEAEAKMLTANPRFKGYIHDVGGPTANFRYPSCKKQMTSGMCRDKKCLGTNPCKNLDTRHDEYIKLLQTLRSIPKVKKVFVRSGIRYDYLLLDKSKKFLRELVAHHVSGQLKVAPEHVTDRVLKKMNKPSIKVYEQFKQEFETENRNAGKEQYLVPYLISSHPGCTLDDAIDLALWLKKEGIRPRQVQDFYPTPGTASTEMYHTGLDPNNLKEKPMFVAKSPADKAMQRALLQWFMPENKALCLKALRQCGRENDAIKLGLFINGKQALHSGHANRKPVRHKPKGNRNTKKR